MLGRRKSLAVCIATTGTETLRLALGALGKLRNNFLLVLHGDVSARAVRRMGYRGAVRIINGNAADARLAIIDKIAKMKNPPEWMIFIHDTDMLVAVDIPPLPENRCAIINNRVMICGGLKNLMRAIANPRAYTIDNKNVIPCGPTAETRGAFLRTKCVLAVRNDINCGDDILRTMQHNMPDGGPIYMDTVNIVEIRQDFGTKPHRPRNVKKSANL